MLQLLLLLAACHPTDEPKGESGDPHQEAPWTAPDQEGPYGVGVETVVFTDTRGTELTLEVWYPAIVEEGDEPDDYPLMAIAFDAHRDADPDLSGAPYPLVAFSHGNSGIRYQSASLTEHLASHGFVVVAPDHPYNTMLDMDEDLFVQVMLARPADVRNAVDEVLRLSTTEDPVLGGMIWDQGFGMMGHSFGGYTSLVVGGGVLDLDGLVNWCADGNPGFLCYFISKLKLGTDPGAGADNRVLATVPLAPGGWYAFGAEGAGLAGVRVPLEMAGTSDDVLDYELEMRPCWDHMGSPRWMGTLANAGHYVFSDACAILPQISDECDGVAGGFIDIAAAQSLIETLVTAHMGLYVAGDDRYQPWLEDAWLDKQPDLTWDGE